MKKYYLLLLFVTSFVSAQIVNIPDANFKTKLLSAAPTNTVAYSNGFPVKIDLNNDSEIQLSEAITIDSLDVSQANFADIEGINSFLNLKKLVANNNQLTTLNVSGLALLKHLNCSNNQISTIDLTSNTNLITLILNGNVLNNVSLTGLTQLKRLEAFSNQLVNIDVTTLSSLQVLYLSNNLLTTLDCSQNINLQGLSVAVNQLVTVFIKNGSDESLMIDPGTWMENWFVNNNPFLQYICADDVQIANIQSITGPMVNVNSYCSFTPGGDFNTISGTTRFDLDNNGCDATDLIFPFLSFDVSLNAADTNAQVYSNALGNFAFLTGQTGIYGLTPNLENPTYFTVSPNPATLNIPVIDNSTTAQNFCITANGIHPDLEIVIVPIIPARPGFDAVYKIVYKNKGNQVVTGTINFTYNESVLDFVSSSLVPNTSGSGFMNWTVPNIAPFQSGSILVTFNVNSPQETPAVNIGDVLAFNANIDVTADDVTADNNFDFNQTVVGSYDPNDITCLEGNALPLADIGTYLHYNIRFENTGTAPAENIVVKSEIDLAQYNIQSLQIMESSHPMEVKVTGNIAEFIFQTINLDTGGHGNILLKLKSNAAMTNNQVVNSADIFFDYNFPIETNDAQTVFADLSKDDFNKDLSIQIYPNPTQDSINITCESTINTVQLFDAQGRLLLTKLVNENKSSIDLSSQALGIYFIKITAVDGVKTEKIIRK